MASKPPNPGPPGERFRKQIEAAVAEGAALADLTLRLTLRDRHLLASDRTLAVEDLSYRGGEMRFLGVRVEEGGVAVSELARGGDPASD